MPTVSTLNPDYKQAITPGGFITRAPQLIQNKQRSPFLNALPRRLEMNGVGLFPRLNHILRDTGPELVVNPASFAGVRDQFKVIHRGWQ